MAQKTHEDTKKMTRLYRKIVRVNIRWRLIDKVSIFQDFFRFIWDRILSCSIGKPVRYRRVSHHRQRSLISPAGLDTEVLETGFVVRDQGGGEEEEIEIEKENPSTTYDSDSDSDLVNLKISLLGDCQIGKTSFVVRTQIFFFLFLLSSLF